MFFEKTNMQCKRGWKERAGGKPDYLMVPGGGSIKVQVGASHVKPRGQAHV